MGDSRVASPIVRRSGQASLAAWGWAKAKGRRLGAMGAPTLSEKPVRRTRGSCRVCFGKGCARPTEYSYGRTTEAHEQRFNGTNLTATLEVG